MARARRKKGGKRGGVAGVLPPTVLVFWNPRGISNKEVVFKHFLDQKGAIYAGVSE